MHARSNHFFDGCADEQEIKTRYRDLAMRMHPDRGGTTAGMQDLNAAYTAALKGEYRRTKSVTEAEEALDLDAAAMEVLNKIIGLPGIQIEIIGCWIWVTGDTRAVKDELKEAGFFWASKKLAWYWRATEHTMRGGKKTLDQIRDTYGSRPVAMRTSHQLTSNPHRRRYAAPGRRRRA